MGVLFAADLWQELGGFDESTFPHYYADSDFCFRARRLGRRVWHCPASVVLNDRHSTGLSIPKDDAQFSQLLESLTSRRSALNIRDAVSFYRRHAGHRVFCALAAQYAIHIAMGAKRVVLSQLSIRRSGPSG